MTVKNKHYFSIYVRKIPPYANEAKDKKYIYDKWSVDF